MESSDSFIPHDFLQGWDHIYTFPNYEILASYQANPEELINLDERYLQHFLTYYQYVPGEDKEEFSPIHRDPIEAFVDLARKHAEDLRPIFNDYLDYFHARISPLKPAHTGRLIDEDLAALTGLNVPRHSEEKPDSLRVHLDVKGPTSAALNAGRTQQISDRFSDYFSKRLRHDADDDFILQEIRNESKRDLEIHQPYLSGKWTKLYTQETLDLLRKLHLENVQQLHPNFREPFLAFYRRNASLSYDEIALLDAPDAWPTRDVGKLWGEYLTAFEKHCPKISDSETGNVREIGMPSSEPENEKLDSLRSFFGGPLPSITVEHTPPDDPTKIDMSDSELGRERIEGLKYVFDSFSSITVKYPFPDDLTTGGWANFYTEENYQHLRLTNADSLKGRYRENFLRFCASNFGTHRMDLDRFIQNENYHIFLNEHLGPYYEFYREAFKLLVPMSDPEFVKSYEQKMIELGYRIPEDLQSWQWGGRKFFSEGRAYDYLRLDFDEFKERAKHNSKERYHFLAYCHYRIKKIEVDRQEFISRLDKDDPFTADEQRNHFFAFRRAINAGRVEKYWDGYRRSFKEIYDDLVRGGDSIVTPESLLQGLPHLTVTEPQRQLLYSMINEHKTLVLYKHILTTLRSTQEDAQLENAEYRKRIASVLRSESMAEYLPSELPTLEKGDLHSLANQVTSVADMNPAQTENFILFCSMRGKNGDDIAGILGKDAVDENERQQIGRLFADFVRLARATNNRLTFPQPKIIAEMIKHFETNQFGILASVLEDIDTYENIVKVMNFFHDKELTKSQMKFLAAKITA
ncbi:hypothetical protein ACIQMR_37645 [Streptomyces sp. NPDC091376]|uniref:hypothetical protein n=1 Tax=Streptomyces sp. NPDC091376 TaxID=3365994 RepID=UPI0037F62B49